jgi:hypothetical protein
MKFTHVYISPACPLLLPLLFLLLILLVSSSSSSSYSFYSLGEVRLRIICTPATSGPIVLTPDDGNRRA